MSSPTWTPDALSSEFRSYAGDCWRLVESQHRVSTLRLVDTLEEQELLEGIIERTKPPVPPECRHLDYLLSTPFRYGSVYPHGSRFRLAGRTLGVYYAAEAVRTAVAEMVFYRYLFHAESPGTPWPDNAAEYTAFSARLATGRMLDLTEPPLSADGPAWAHKTDYSACQAFADAAREAGGDLIRYHSVRDTEGGINLAVLACPVFARARPLVRQTWRILIGESSAQAICEFPSERLEFPRQAYDDPRLNPLEAGVASPQAAKVRRQRTIEGQRLAAPRLA